VIADMKESRRVLIAVDAIPDAFSTILNVTGDLAAAALVARRDL
jgi:Na+/H+-dicarboxylate symporter